MGLPSYVHRDLPAHPLYIDPLSEYNIVQSPDIQLDTQQSSADLHANKNSVVLNANTSVATCHEVVTTATAALNLNPLSTSVHRPNSSLNFPEYTRQPSTHTRLHGDGAPVHKIGPL